MYSECRHIKSNGCKCQPPALRGAAYCYFHRRLHRMQHARKAGPVAAEPNSDAALDLPVIEDGAAIQLALTQILQDLGAKRLDPRRAGQLLYGLQIASQILRRPDVNLYSRYVQTVTTGSDGEELGPQQFVCDEDDDCGSCPNSQSCTHRDDEDDD